MLPKMISYFQIQPPQTPTWQPWKGPTRRWRWGLFGCFEQLLRWRHQVARRGMPPWEAHHLRRCRGTLELCQADIPGAKHPLAMVPSSRELPRLFIYLEELIYYSLLHYLLRWFLFDVGDTNYMPYFSSYADKKNMWQNTSLTLLKHLMLIFIRGPGLSRFGHLAWLNCLLLREKDLLYSSYQ